MVTYTLYIKLRESNTFLALASTTYVDDKYKGLQQWLTNVNCTDTIQ